MITGRCSAIGHIYLINGNLNTGITDYSSSLTNAQVEAICNLLYKWVDINVDAANHYTIQFNAVNSVSSDSVRVWTQRFEDEV